MARRCSDFEGGNYEEGTASALAVQARCRGSPSSRGTFNSFGFYPEGWEAEQLHRGAQMWLTGDYYCDRPVCRHESRMRSSACVPVGRRFGKSSQASAIRKSYVTARCTGSMGGDRRFRGVRSLLPHARVCPTVRPRKDYNKLAVKAAKPIIETPKPAGEAPNDAVQVIGGREGEQA